jgi:hypothetical protein
MVQNMASFLCREFAGLCSDFTAPDTPLPQLSANDADVEERTFALEIAGCKCRRPYRSLWRESFRTGRINREETPKKVGIRRISNGSNHHGFSLQKEGRTCSAATATGSPGSDSIPDSKPVHD